MALAGTAQPSHRTTPNMFAASKSGKPASGADTNFNNTVLLLETTGTNGQQNNTFLDSSTNNFTVTRTGTPTQGTFTPFSQTGWSENGGASDGLIIPQTTSTDLGSGDFSIECFVYVITSGIIITKRPSDNGIAGDWYLSAGDTAADFGPLLGGGITGTFSSIANTWTHIAACRTGTTMSLYVGGVRVATATNSVNFTCSQYTFIQLGGNTLGKYPSGTGLIGGLIGYVSNLRLVKGSSAYVASGSSITVPTSPLTAITNTQLLTLQSNRFVDNSSNNLAFTIYGAPSIQAFSPFAPAAAYSTATVGGSGYFNGTTDYLRLSTVTALQMTGDFTWEAWVYPTSVPTGGNYKSLWAQRVNDPSYGGPIVAFDSAGALFLFISNSAGTAFAINGASTSLTVSLNQWQHLALVKNGTSLILYKNGVAGSTATSSQAVGTSADTTLMAGAADGIQKVDGYMSNFRIVKGTAVYTANFTPPTAPLTAISGTSLLLNGTNAGIYDATAKNLETTVGSAQASTAQSKFGGSSMLFNGTTDYLTTIDKPIAQLGTGDFTIEGWVYLSAVGTARGLVSKGAAATGWSVGISAANVLTFAYTASTLTAATALSVSTWYYFAVVRSGTATGNVKIYLNGSVDATSSGAITDNFNQTSTGYIGADRVGTSLLSGYLDEVRVTRVARTITTPTAAFPTS